MKRRLKPGIRVEVTIEIIPSEEKELSLVNSMSIHQ
jgi:hypothetical protein